MVHHEPMNSPPSAPASGRVTAAAAVAAVVAALAGSAIATAYDRAGTAAFAGTLSFAFAVGAVAVVGAVITLAVPGNRVGWLLLAAAACDGSRRGAALRPASTAWSPPRARSPAPLTWPPSGRVCRRRGC